MDYFKYIILVFIILILGIGVYFGISTYNKQKMIAQATEAPRLYDPEKTKPKSKIVKPVEYTSIWARDNNQPLKIKGRVKAMDTEDRTIDDMQYVFVLGLSMDDGSFYSIHLTQYEYDQISYFIANGNIKLQMTAEINFNDDGSVTVEGFYY